MKPFALGLLLVALASPASAQRSCGMEDLASEARTQCKLGVSDAIRHLNEGVPEWHWWGIPDHTTPVADSLLWTRYALRPVFHGDIVEGYEDLYTEAYNDVVRDRLAPHFGDDFAARAFVEARTYFPGQEALNVEVLRDIPAPPGACAAAERCFVVVRLNVAPSGEPSGLRVFRSSDDVLNDRALTAASQVRFRPAPDVENGRSLSDFAVLVRFSRE